MARLKTANTPNLDVLLLPASAMTLAVEQAVQRGHQRAITAAPVADQVAVRIAAAITMNRIQAGQRLLEADISKVLQVSRAPVREALRILERERLVEFQARQGAVVTAPDADDLQDIYIVRDALYQILLQQLLTERPAKLRAAFEWHMPKLATAAEKLAVDDYTLESFLLNLAITDLSSNRLIVDLLTSISLRTLRYVRLGLTADPGRLLTSLKSWRALKRAVDRQDLAAVLDTARKRMAGSRDAAISALTQPPSTRLRGLPSHEPRQARSRVR